MRNVSGEILGAMAAVERAIELKLPEVTIYYDYMGIEMWAEEPGNGTGRARSPTMNICSLQK